MTDILSEKNITIIAIEKTHMKMDIGFCRRILSIFENNNVICMHISPGLDSISLVIEDSELDNKLHKILEEIENQCSPDSLITCPNMALIAVVEKYIIRTSELSAKIFCALSKHDVNIKMINQGSNELTIIVNAENNNFKNAIKAVHEAFEY